MNSKVATVETILDRAERGENISPGEGITLLQQEEPEVIAAIAQTADRLRKQQVGDTVTYVVNRNINFTNICEQHCNFCAFRRDAGESGSFWLDSTQISEKNSRGSPKRSDRNMYARRSQPRSED